MVRSRYHREELHNEKRTTRQLVKPLMSAVGIPYLGQPSSGKGQIPNELTLPVPTSLREALKFQAFGVTGLFANDCILSRMAATIGAATPQPDNQRKGIDLVENE